MANRDLGNWYHEDNQKARAMIRGGRRSTQEIAAYMGMTEEYVEKLRKTAWDNHKHVNNYTHPKLHDGIDEDYFIKEENRWKQDAKFANTNFLMALARATG